MDFELSPDQRRIQTLARDFANDEVAPLAREADETGVFPEHLIGRMAALGFLGWPDCAVSMAARRWTPSRSRSSAKS